MPCYRPLKGYRSRERNPETGKRSIVFNSREGLIDMPQSLACGRCIGCRLKRSGDWAIRCVHEAQSHEDNSFITLTYSDDFLPKDGSLKVKHYQDFMKRLRKRFGPGIRFFQCGEYGEKFSRPHYHSLLFNFDFPDKVEWRKTRDGHQIWRSFELERLWPFGYCEIGSVSFESAAYVARYITKKVTGEAGWYDKKGDYHPGATEHYGGRKPEYLTMSRRPGIAKKWFDQFYRDIYPSDFVVLNGKQMGPPKFYDSQYEALYPSEYERLRKKFGDTREFYELRVPPSQYEALKASRRRNAKRFAEKEPEWRLSVREEVQQLKAAKLIRGYENET